MTVTELIQKLIELENEGCGDSLVFLSGDEFLYSNLKHAGNVGICTIHDDAIAIHPTGA